MRWTSREIRYLEEHANDGAEEIARNLGRSRHSVEVQASRFGISIRKQWLCPKCGHTVFRPLSSVTGWCASCTKALRRKTLADEVRRLEEEVRRERDEDRARQALYSRKHRAKEKLKKTRKK